MPTADQYAHIVSKRILGWETFKDNLLDYLRDYDQSIVAEVYRSSGTFIALGLAGDGPDEFKITGFTGEGVVAIDGAGGFLDLDAQLANVEDVPFENTNTIDYYVAIKREDLPQGITVAQGDGIPNWDTKKEVIGWAANPDSVVDNGTTMTFVVNSVTESGVTNAGRKVAVYKIVPAKDAITESLALEEIAVVWDSPNNKITTTTVGTGGAGVFGQTTPSTTASDYIVVLLGPRVSRGTDLRPLTAWCFIGIVTGKGSGNEPDTFDTSDQNVMAIPLSDLAHITRYENVPPNRLKIEVKAIAGEAEVAQISVKDSGAAVVFSVDEDGDIVFSGTIGSNILPIATDSKNIGSWDLTTHTGTRWKRITGNEIVVTGSASPIARLVFDKTNEGSNEKIWEIQAAGQSLRFGTKDDSDASFADGMNLIRSGNAITTVQVDANIEPKTVDTKEIGTAAKPFFSGRFADIVSAKFVELKGDPGAGNAGTVRLTDIAAGVSTGNGVVKMNSANSGDSVGWLKFWLGTTAPGDGARWFPFWDNIAP